MDDVRGRGHWRMYQTLTCLHSTGGSGADELTGPYPFFQSTTFSSESFEALIKTINTASSRANQLTEKAVEGAFSDRWHEFEELWRSSLAQPPNAVTFLSPKSDNNKAMAQMVNMLAHAKETQASEGYFASESEFAEWAYRYHDFIHVARDVCVRLLSAQKRNDNALPPVAVGQTEPLPHPVLEEFRPAILTLLNTMVDVFRKLLPGKKVWVCLRDIRSDGRFYTFERAGKYESNRCMTSLPMDGDCDDIKLLREKFSSGDCVIITGEGKEGWHSQPNDELYHENMSVLMGAVIAKDTDGKRVWNGPLSWVLCVNSPEEDVFTTAHKRVLQGCNDSFSAIANVMLRAKT